jgi:hypothetical protein
MRFALLFPLAALALSRPVLAVPLDLDGGFRASIWDENYKLGVGGELGMVMGAGPKLDVGAHLNYSHFTHKTMDFPDHDELGGYLTLYFVPLQDDSFRLRLGPHVGGNQLDGWNLDVGGDIAAVFKINDRTLIYGAFIPAYLIGSDSQGIFRVGFGAQYRLSD